MAQGFCRWQKLGLVTRKLNADLSAIALQGLHPESDADLLSAAGQRDAEAFGRLVTKYHGLVYRVVWRITNGSAESEDIAQEAFLKLWNNPGQLRQAGALKGWLARVAHNMAMDWFRHRRTGATLDDIEVADLRPSVEDNLNRDWVTSRINAAVATLPDRQKLALTLVHFEHFSQPEAAAAMELSVDAFESLLARSRRALKELLANDRQDLLACLQDKD
jgi:RNA polymerase sigma-70 factor, ECF subfamily